MSDVLDKKSDTGTLWVTDAELIRRSGVPRDKMRQTLHMLDKDYKRSGFPQKKAIFGDRRYWPAVVAYFDRVGGLTMQTSANQRGSDD